MFLDAHDSFSDILVECSVFLFFLFVEFDQWSLSLFFVFFFGLSPAAQGDLKGPD